MRGEAFLSLESTRVIFLILRNLFLSLGGNFSNRDIKLSCMFAMKLTLKLFFPLKKKIILLELNI